MGRGGRTTERGTSASTTSNASTTLPLEILGRFSSARKCLNATSMLPEQSHHLYLLQPCPVLNVCRLGRAASQLRCDRSQGYWECDWPNKHISQAGHMQKYCCNQAQPPPPPPPPPSCATWCDTLGKHFPEGLDGVTCSVNTSKPQPNCTPNEMNPVMQTVLSCACGSCKELDGATCTFSDPSGPGLPLEFDCTPKTMNAVMDRVISSVCG